MDFIWWPNRRLPSWRNGYVSRADEARSAAAERRSLDSAAQWTAVARYQAVNSERRRPGPARLGYNLAALQSMNPVIPSYTVAAVMLNLYATGAPAGHWTGPLKQHAGLKPGFGSIRPLLPIFTSFLHQGRVPGPGPRPLQNERRPYSDHKLEKLRWIRQSRTWTWIEEASCNVATSRFVDRSVHSDGLGRWRAARHDEAGRQRWARLGCGWADTNARVTRTTLRERETWSQKSCSVLVASASPTEVTWNKCQLTKRPPPFSWCRFITGFSTI